MEIRPTFQADLPLVCEFLGVGDTRGPASRLGPRARHRRLLEIILHMVRQGGLALSVILIEDLHWFDDASEDFVATLVDAIAGTRTLLILNYRPSYSASWMNSSSFHQLTLAELSPTAADALVEELVGARLEVRDIRRRIAERSGGNPFFAEELVRSLAESGSLLGNPRDYMRGLNTDEGFPSATIQAVIGARIDRLHVSEKTLLHIAAIIGKDFPLVVLQKVAGTLVGDIETALERLCNAELLQNQPRLDGRWYAFRHPLLQEVAYVTQLKTRRSGLHASVARAMRDYYKDRLDEFSALLAYHFEAAGLAA